MECAELFDPAGVGEFYGETPDFIGGDSGWTPPGSWDGARRNVSWWDRLGGRAGRAKYSAKNRVCSPLFAFVRGFGNFFINRKMDDDKVNKMKSHELNRKKHGADDLWK
jgi:hypothetical protein